MIFLQSLKNLIRNICLNLFCRWDDSCFQANRYRTSILTGKLCGLLRRSSRRSKCTRLARKSLPDPRLKRPFETRICRTQQQELFHKLQRKKLVKKYLKIPNTSLSFLFNFISVNTLINFKKA